MAHCDGFPSVLHFLKRSIFIIFPSKKTIIYDFAHKNLIFNVNSEVRNRKEKKVQ